MAYTKIHAIKATVHKAIAYICNPVIIPSGQRGKKYNEWSADKHSASYKSNLRRDINSADTYEEFLYLMRAKGYVVKGEMLNVKSPKYISFLPPGSGNFVRGSARSLGSEYTKERIFERILERVQNRGKILPGVYAPKRLIDTSQEK